MTHEDAAEFMNELQHDDDATARADQAYLEAVAAVAAEKGYDVTTDEIREVMQAIAGVGDDVAGFAGKEQQYYTIQLVNASAASAIDNDAFQNQPFTPHFTPLGFLKR